MYLFYISHYVYIFHGKNVLAYIHFKLFLFLLLQRLLTARETECEIVPIHCGTLEQENFQPLKLRKTPAFQSEA